VSTTGCRTSNEPVRFALVAGAIPPGMTGPFTQGVGSGGITGRPTTVGVFNFTLRVTDQTGSSDTESFQITVDPARGLIFNHQTLTLTTGTVGAFYCCGNLFADGGTPPYRWTRVAGILPPGLSLQASPGRITGTPTTAGTFVFRLRVTDARGAFIEGDFTININPRP
jgi:hypothetical protein